MVIGSGLIGEKFKIKYASHNDVVIFASGVSDSTANEEQLFVREINLLNKTINSIENKTLIYFSTISVFDKENISSYVKHKLFCEHLIINKVSKYIIFRLPQLFGFGGNKTNLFNYLKNSIIKNEKVVIWDKAFRYIIDIDDVYEIVNECIDIKENGIINVFGIEKINLLKLITIFEQCLLKKAEVVIINKQSDYIISEYDTEFINSMIYKLKLKKENYIEETIKKYL